MAANEDQKDLHWPPPCSRNPSQSGRRPREAALLSRIHALPAARFNYWIKRLDREAHMAQLVPVRIQQPVSAAELTLHGPSGWTMRINARVEPAWLAALLSGLR